MASPYLGLGLDRTVHRQGCCKVENCCLSSEGRQGTIELISELPPRFSEISSASTDQQPDDNIIEDCQHVRSMPHAKLGMILPHGRIPSVMQAVLNAPMAPSQFQ